MSAHSVAAGAGAQTVAAAAGTAVADAGKAVAGSAVAVVAGGEAAGFGMARGDVDKVVAADHSRARHRRMDSRYLEVPLTATVVVVAEGSCCRAGGKGLAAGGGN